MKKYAYIFDTVALLIFVAIGRRAHEHGITVAGMASTFWPFAIGLLAGWILIIRTNRDLTATRSGLWIVVVTVALGMVLRVVSGQGTAVTFIIVALVFQSLFLMGWRAVFGVLAQRRLGEEN